MCAVLLPPGVDPIADNKYTCQPLPQLSSSYVTKRPVQFELYNVNLPAVNCDPAYEAAHLTFELELTGTRSTAA